MKIKKPHSIILSKKYPDRYFDWDTDEEFTHSEINEHPYWYKRVYDADGYQIYHEKYNGKWIY